MISESFERTPAQAAERSITVSLGSYWHRIVLFGIVVLATTLNFYDLSKEGYGNTYYAAAVKSMSENWHAFFFNSLDPTGFVTIDKPPLGFWLQVLSTKIFGFNGVSLMLPQALAGILSVILLYYLVSRSFGAAAGLLAALALAISPISVVASRNNIIDGTLVLAVLLAAWAVTRAVETGKLRWLLLCAFFLGLGFNIKMLEAYLVVPACGLVYLVAARIGWGRRLAYLVVGGLTLLAVSLAWVVTVDSTPAGQRPWVGSTTTNSEIDLALGYNGLQRLTGNVFGRRGNGAPPAGGATGAPGGFSAGETGASGPLRLLNSQLGGQIGWLLPLAIVGFLVAAWQRRRRWPLDEQSAALVLWGTWLLTTGVFFSIAGFFHTYYLVMMAPAIAALAGIGLVALWRQYRDSRYTWWSLPVSLLGVAAVQVHLLNDYPSWSRWLTPLILGITALAVIVLVWFYVRPGQPSANRNVPALSVQAAVAALVLGVGGVLAAPAAWAADSVANSASGLIPRAGPSASNTGGGFGGAFAFRRPGGGFELPAGGFGGGRFPGGDFPRGAFRRGGGGFGGPEGGTVNKSLLQYLEQHQGTAKYLFATQTAGTAEAYILATGKAVMAMGGFLGSDPILTPTKVAALVKAGTIRYFLLPAGGDFQLPPAAGDAGGRFTPPGGFGGRFGRNSAVTSWVQQHCTVVPAGQYGGMPATGTGAPAGGFGGGFRSSGPGQLYSCSAAQAR